MKLYRYVLVAAIFLFALSVADYLLTMWVLSLGGSEINPVMDPIIRTPIAPILKIVVVGFVCYAIVRHLRTPFFVFVLSAVTVYYVAVVAWNSTQIYLYFN